jgi:hypothetical protein
MLQSTDLYTILIFYARKVNSPVFAVGEFIRFLEKYAHRYEREMAGWKEWTDDVDTKVRAELDELVKKEKCKLIGEKGAAKVLILDFYFEIVNEAYRDNDSLVEIPFPDEKTLGISVPPEHVRNLNIGPDMEKYMNAPQQTDMPLLRIIFPESLGSALIFAGYIPRRLLSISLLKVAAFLEIGHNMGFFFTRLSGQFAEREGLLKSTMSQIKSGLENCLKQIEDAGAFSYRFWLAFCSQLQHALKKKTELTTPDISVFQAAFIIEFFSDYYYKVAMRNKEKEVALKEIELNIDDPPYMYTLKEIMAFTNSSGRPLRDYYDQKDLVDFLEKNSFFDKHAGPETRLPPLLIFNSNTGDPIYIYKSRVLSAVAQLITETQPRVQQGIFDHWTDCLKRFYREPSMKDDKEFEKLVARYLDRLSPKLMAFLNDKKLFLVQDEMISTVSEEEYRNAVIYQTDGTMRPFSNLLRLNRRALLSNVKIMLPLWYSIPLFLAIGAFLFGKRGDKKKKDVPNKESPDVQRPATVRGTKQVALDYQQQKLPPEKSLEQYLGELEGQWLKMVSSENKKQLVQDVRRQIRAGLKSSLEVRKNIPITLKSVDEIAEGIIIANPSLAELGLKEKVHKYVALYISSLLAQ